MISGGGSGVAAIRPPRLPTGVPEGARRAGKSRTNRRFRRAVRTGSRLYNRASRIVWVIGTGDCNAREETCGQVEEGQQAGEDRSQGGTREESRQGEGCPRTAGRPPGREASCPEGSAEVGSPQDEVEGKDRSAGEDAGRSEIEVRAGQETKASPSTGR